MKKAISITTKSLIALFISFIAYWFILPPINLRSWDFWSFLILILVIFNITFLFPRLIGKIRGGKTYTVKTSSKGLKTAVSKWPLLLKVSFISVGVFFLLSIIISIIGSRLFNAKAYHNLIIMQDGDFSVDITEIEREQIPVVDRDTATRLGQRKLGEIADLVSQFEILENYTQINYQGKPVRVTPLAYSDAIKWLNNHGEGVPAYIMVDMTTQETSLVKLSAGMKYSESEYFMRNINRYLRFKYPTKIFGDLSFEIDENGTPYYIATTLTYKIGLWNGTDVQGAVILNAITGESKYYDVSEIPSWIDRVYDADMIISQLTDNGRYRSGFFNSIFGQKGVLQPTEGYNYLAIGDDVYLYTGFTSVTSDESNIGFVLVNMRTKETKFYAVPGAEEYSAMSSAEGQVQNLGYTATFPLLLNVADRPSYFMSLKDSAGLVKMYAFVDVQQYQIVGTGNTVEKARADYIEKLGEEIKNDTPETEPETVPVEGKIKKINSAVVDGNTVYYIFLEGSPELYEIPVKLCSELVFAEVGDAIVMDVVIGEDTTVVKDARVPAYSEIQPK